MHPLPPNASIRFADVVAQAGPRSTDGCSGPVQRPAGVSWRAVPSFPWSPHGMRGLNPKCRAEPGERGAPDSCACWLRGAASTSPSTFLPPRAVLGGNAAQMPRPPRRHPRMAPRHRWAMVSSSTSCPKPGGPRAGLAPHPRHKQLPVLLQGSVLLLLLSEGVTLGSGALIVKRKGRQNKALYFSQGIYKASFATG